jgi:hypothetical protein
MWGRFNAPTPGLEAYRGQGRYLFLLFQQLFEPRDGPTDLLLFGDRKVRALLVMRRSTSTCHGLLLCSGFRQGHTGKAKPSPVGGR